MARDTGSPVPKQRKTLYESVVGKSKVHIFQAIDSYLICQSYDDSKRRTVQSVRDVSEQLSV